MTPVFKVKSFTPKGTCFQLILVTILLFISSNVWSQKAKGAKNIYAKDNLIAWCIVPFDSKNRGPVERAEMLNRLGINKLAYDWREKHIPTFDAELDALKSHKIDLQAFWLYSGPEPEKDKNLAIILDVLKRHKVKTQIWCMVAGIEDLDQMTQQEKVNVHARAVAYIADKAAEIGCSVGLYNHGGWFGEPENQLEIINYLKKPNIGIVYNLHHAEEQIETFPKFFPKMLPHLMAFNVAGLQKGNPVKVVPVGQGDAEMEMMQIVKRSSYSGPVGIINENFAPDAEEGLKMNLDGLKKILKETGDTAALKTY
ncbi:sugar phosphate isomerase/epimerase family protein [Dyadobacter arcticus]|uniref:Sugar phosphate isomerase/epimerase n=1 Tax=Dyadobacter arcticus TaxID=1078754 RepID=A0ABX0URP2_9BACT|nr:TIM barrel protein [Dyadobacter arcticus]NIJ55658.1 sugar phosphate isomerase/epimerase [Dyadobacter arcticus]